MIAAGATDQAIANRIGGISRMGVSRHRANHVVAPAKAMINAAGRGRDVADQRAQLMAAAAEPGDPLAYVALASIVGDLRRVHDRLERTAEAAEQDKQRLAVATLSGQQLRAAEVRAKIGGVGAYAPGKAGEGVGAKFAVNIHLNGQTLTITAPPTAATIDAEEGDDGAPLPDGLAWPLRAR